MGTSADSTFLTSEFGRLVASITSHGGNVEPVVARPLRDVGSSNLPGKVDRVVGYEIVTGHLRCAASRIASTPVLVTITEIEHEATFLQMLAANQCRQPLSPYEVGVAYDTALKTKLFPDQQSIAEATHVDKSMISEGVRLGRLPDFVVKAFADPRSLQYAFAKPLGDALRLDHGAVERRAREIRQRPDFESLKPKAVVDLLTGTAARAEQECTVRIVVGSVTVARARLDGSGHFHIAYGQLGADKKATQEFVRRLLRSVESQPLDG